MELESNFGLFDPVGEVEAKIKTLVMGEKSCSMTYFVEFNHLVSHIRLSTGKGVKYPRVFSTSVQVTPHLFYLGMQVSLLAVEVT